MKKVIVSVLTLAAFVSQSFSTMVVHDPVIMAQNAVSEIANYLKYLQTQVQSLDQYTTQLQQYSNQITALTRYGNPAALTNIPGMQAVGQLANTGMTLMRDYSTVQSLINPQRYQATVGQIMAAYSQNPFNNTTSALGVMSQLNQGSNQFYTSQYEVVSRINILVGQIEQEKQTVQNNIAAVTAEMQGATDSSTVQKLHAMLSSLQMSLAELNAREQSLQQRAALLLSQISAAQGVYRSVQDTQNGANFQSAMESGLMLSGGQPAAGGTMLTAYGFKNDATGDPASLAGQGAFGFDSAPGSLIPLTSAAVTPSFAQTWGLQPGQNFSILTSTGQTMELQYADVAPQFHKGNNLGNRVDVYDPNSQLGSGGNTGNNFSGSVISVSKKSSIY
jgi:hypothetical protein